MILVVNERFVMQGWTLVLISYWWKPYKIHFVDIFMAWLKLILANLDLRHFSCSLRKLNLVCHLIWVNFTRFLMNFTGTTHGWEQLNGWGHNGTTITCTVESSWYFGFSILKLLYIILFNDKNRHMELIYDT